MDKGQTLGHLSQKAHQAGAYTSSIAWRDQEYFYPPPPLHPRIWC